MRTDTWNSATLYSQKYVDILPSHPYVIVEDLLPDLFLFCYNNLHSYVKAFH